jgi:hypothetical protein
MSLLQTPVGAVSKEFTRMICAFIPNCTFLMTAPNGQQWFALCVVQRDELLDYIANLFEC